MSLNSGGFFLLSGRAGSGKTYLTARLIEYIESELGLAVAVTAPTHKAVSVLNSFIKSGETYTTHAFLGMREEIDKFGKIKFVTGKAMTVPAENFRVVVVDEASMVPDVIFDEIEKLVRNYQYKVIFVGDSKQIPPVGFPDSLPFDVETQRDLGFEVAELTHIVRQAQDNPIIQVASEIREASFRPVVLTNFESRVHGLIGVSFYEYDRINDVMPEIFDMYASEEFKKTSDYIKIIAYTNAHVNKYNNVIRKHLYGDVPKLIVGDKLITDAPVVEKRKIVVKNNMDMEVVELKVLSENVGGMDLSFYHATVDVIGMESKKERKAIRVIHEDSEKNLKALLHAQATLATGYAPGSYQAKTAWMDFYALKNQYAQVKYSYAITCHKAQGSTYDHAVVDMRDIMRNQNVHERNRILYTAVTRPKYTLKIFH